MASVVTIYEVHETLHADSLHTRHVGTYRRRDQADEAVASYKWPKSYGARVHEVLCLEVDGRLFELGAERRPA